MASFDSVNVRCSFFVNDKAGSICYKIICEGITDRSTISWLFQDKEDYKIQMKTFCCDRYTNCELYRVLIEKEEYEDDSKA